MKKVVILGGGYGGIRIASRLLEKTLAQDIQITLIDRTPYHSIKTEFYALAAGSISDADVRIDFPDDSRLNYICDEVLSVDLNAKKVSLRENSDIEYDYLTIGLGCEDNYHGIEGAEAFTHSVQTIKKARKTYEAIANMEPYGTVTIVGAGLTGVELASELKETRGDLHIRLLDKGETILPSMPKRLQTYIQKWFDDHKVEVIHNAHIDYVEEKAVCNDGECLLSDVTIWAAGIQPSKVVRELEVNKDKYGRIAINEFYQIPEHPEVFVVGDCSSVPYPPSAQVAKVQGVQVAGMLRRLLVGKELYKPSPIKTKGTLGSLGKKDGFGISYNMSMIGAVPRLMKSGVLWLHKFNKG